MIKSTLVLAGLVFAVLGGFPARAQTSIDIAKITCEQYILHKVSDPRNIAIWLDGYFHAKRGDTVVEVERLDENAKKVMDFCRANLKVTIMQAVEKVLGPDR